MQVFGERYESRDGFLGEKRGIGPIGRCSKTITSTFKATYNSVDFSLTNQLTKSDLTLDDLGFSQNHNCLSNSFISSPMKNVEWAGYINQTSAEITELPSRMEEKVFVIFDR
jgi:hypothetical protein